MTTVNVSASSSRSALSASWESLPHVSLGDVPHVVEDDRLSVTSEKAYLSEGLSSALRLVFQLCPAADVEAPLQPQRTF